MRFQMLIGFGLLMCCTGCPSSSRQAAPKPERPAGEAKEEAMKTEQTQAEASGIHAFTLKDIDGRDLPLSQFKGRAVLIVNVASKCGYTPQYEGLQKLHSEYKDRGLVVLGVPSNEFGGQEPGTEAEIKQFCSTKYNVDFPMTSKVAVKKGPEQTPLYQYLTHKDRNGTVETDVAWNFNKFLVGKDGRVIKYYPSKVKPDDAELIADINAALGR